jgi:murein DD-endopeptidase MepM/ murein hydrolase activator NlpD
MRAAIGLALAVALGAGAAGAAAGPGAGTADGADTCGVYPAADSSPYVLPYPAGKAYEVIQGNCAAKGGKWTHFDASRYAYDFGMPIGSQVVAVRAGVVVFVREHFSDRDHRPDQANALVVQHDDGTLALYGHLTRDGVLPDVGDRVRQGEVIARSGNSGQSPVPHLHFQVYLCGDSVPCPTLPVTFRNARPNPDRLERDRIYEAATPAAGDSL